MPKLTDLGSFNSPEQLDDNYIQPEEKIIENICEICDQDFDKENERCIECINNLAHNE